MLHPLYDRQPGDGLHPAGSVRGRLYADRRRFAIEVSGYDGDLLPEEADPLETRFILPGKIPGSCAEQGRFGRILFDEKSIRKCAPI